MRTDTLRRLCTTTAAIALLAVASSPGHAKEDVADLIDGARVALREGDVERAARQAGRAAARAQDEDSLEAQSDVHELLDDLLADASLPRPASDGETTDRRGGLQYVLGLCLEELDGGVAGAFVAPSALARGLLYTATISGDSTGVAAAAEVAADFAKARDTGLAADVLADYAAGALLVSRGEFAAATDPLGAAFQSAGEHGWSDLRFHAGMELVVARLSAGDEEAATAAMKTVSEHIVPGIPNSVRNAAIRFRTTRLADAPESVRQPLSDAIEALGGASVGASGGAGGAGGLAGGGLAEVGKLLPKLRRKKPLAEVERVEEGFEIRFGWDLRDAVPQPLQDGYKYASKGGLALGFAGHGVALVMVDPTGKNGMPGESSELPLDAPLYLLAPGETWSVDKAGVVRIK